VKEFAKAVKSEPEGVVKRFLPKNVGGIRKVYLREALRKVPQENLERALSAIEETANLKLPELHERKRIYNIHAEHDLTPLASIVLARAMGLKLSIENDVISNWHNNGYHTSAEEVSAKRKRYAKPAQRKSAEADSGKAPTMSQLIMRGRMKALYKHVMETPLEEHEWRGRPFAFYRKFLGVGDAAVNNYVAELRKKPEFKEAFEKLLQHKNK
jgi:hypothetical protein